MTGLLYSTTSGLNFSHNKGLEEKPKKTTGKRSVNPCLRGSFPEFSPPTPPNMGGEKGVYPSREGKIRSYLVKNIFETSDKGYMRNVTFVPTGKPTVSCSFLSLLVICAATISWVFPESANACAWPVEREWTEEEELAYSKWFEKLASKQWRSTNRMLHDPEFNSLHDEIDEKIFFYADCADLPYVIRAYYAFKRRLPFIANEVSGGRYTSKGNQTASTCDNLTFEGTVQRFFSRLDLAHSGNFRTAPDAADSFTYPIAIDRRNLRPGMVFYSPNGHVAMVAECQRDGTVKLLDAHPDQSVTRITFGPKLEVRSQTFSGGFRGFRPVMVTSGKVAWATDNSQLPGFSKEQYDFENYHEKVKERLRQIAIDPLVEFERYIREDTFREVLDRVEAVDLGWQVGRERAIPVPPNVYDAVGDWENYSSPSRDLRLRLSMLNIPEQVRNYIQLLRDDPTQLATEYGSERELGLALLEQKERLFRELTFQYIDSLGQPVTLTLYDVETSLFRLSFDPNHVPELRWGAVVSGASRLHERHRAGYEEQQRWRNRLAKKQGTMRPNDPDNPPEPPRHDLSSMIQEIIDEYQSTLGDQVAVSTRETGT